MEKEKVENLEDIKVTSIEDRQEKARPYLTKFNKAKTFNAGRQDAYSELMAFYQGNQHLLTKYKTEKPWVVSMNTPYAAVAIDNRVSSMLASDYQGEILPLSPEDSDTVSRLNEAMLREWRRLDIDDIVRESIKKSAIVREAYCHIVLNKKKLTGGTKSKRLGALEAYMIEPSCIYIDPTARNLRDARYMVVAGRISKDEAQELYTYLKDCNFNQDGSTPADRGEVYISNDYTTEQDDTLSKLSFYEKKKGKIERTVIIGGVWIDTYTMDIDTFPIAQLRWKKAAQSCYGLSLMDEVLSLQKAVTSIESAITNTAIAYAAPSMMVRKGCGVDPKVVAKANGAPGVVYAVDGDINNAIKPVVAPQISADIVNIKTDYQNQINTVTGNTPQFLGSLGSAGNTSGGANVAVERAKIIELDVLNSIREYIEDITDILVKFIIKLYAGKQLTSYDGKDGKGAYKFSTIDMPKASALNNLEYSYYIELESKTPYSKERQKQALLEIFQLERQYRAPIKTVTVSDIIKNSDLENKEEIIERFNKLAYQDAETKAQTIVELYAKGTSLGSSPELITQAIVEIIASDENTPAIDQLLKDMEQKVKEQMAIVQKAQQEENMIANGEMDANMMMEAQTALSGQGQGQTPISPEAYQAAEQMLMQ